MPEKKRERIGEVGGKGRKETESTSEPASSHGDACLTMVVAAATTDDDEDEDEEEEGASETGTGIISKCRQDNVKSKKAKASWCPPPWNLRCASI